MRDALIVGIRCRLAMLPARWRWTLHNVVGHPLSEILYQIGARRMSDIAHEVTSPMGGERDPEARG